MGYYLSLLEYSSRMIYSTRRVMFPIASSNGADDMISRPKALLHKIQFIILLYYDAFNIGKVIYIYISVFMKV